jgi:hypothetical protein
MASSELLTEMVQGIPLVADSNSWGGDLWTNVSRRLFKKFGEFVGGAYNIMGGRFDTHTDGVP